MITPWAVVVSGMVISLGVVIWHVIDELDQRNAQRRRDAAARVRQSVAMCDRTRR